MYIGSGDNRDERSVGNGFCGRTFFGGNRTDFYKKRLYMNSLKILIGTVLSFLVIYFVIISGVYSSNAYMAGDTLSLSLTGTTGFSVFGILIDNYVLSAVNAHILKIIAIIPEFLVIFMGYSIPIVYCVMVYKK